MRSLNFVLLAVTLVSASALAQSKTIKPEKPIAEKPKAAATKQPEEPAAVNFNSSDVWDVDIFRRDDHKVLVVQDRRFVKAKRFELGLHGGVTKASPFYNSLSYGASADYYFTEYLGIDMFYNKASNSLSADAQQINDFLTQASFSSVKEYHAPKYFYGFGLLWSPIYGKFAFFRRSIIHFDFFGTLGASCYSLTTNAASQGGRDQTKWGSLASLGVRVFLNNYWSLRFDTRHNAYKAYFAPAGPASNPGESSTLLRQNFQFTLGTSFIL